MALEVEPTVAPKLLSHWYVYPELLPVAVTLAVPLLPLGHDGVEFIPVMLTVVMFTVVVKTLKQPFGAVTLQVKTCPAETGEIVAVPVFPPFATVTGPLGPTHW